MPMDEGFKMGPRVPRSVKLEEARELWREFCRGRETISHAERLLLLQACSTVAELARMQEALENGAVMVAGSAKNMRPNPLFDEIRRHRTSLGELLERLHRLKPPQSGSAAGRGARARSGGAAQRLAAVSGGGD